MIGRLKRTTTNDKQTTGILTLHCDGCKSTLELFTLELPYLDNEKSISSIPTGEYIVQPRISEKYGKHFIITNVVDRSYILIHYGNYYTHTRGCVLVGTSLVDINGDGLNDVINSRKSMNKLVKFTGWREFKLIISDGYR
tara:strand:- start:2881 stop:3300 length:420 start_codon:yes stop_codon:yes gene_type:complete